MQLDTCYNCHKQGHWARECPEKAKITTTEPCTAPESPTKHCPCGGGPCDVRISGTAKNPNRKFYSCPADPARRCNFFAWCDTVIDDDQRFRMPKHPSAFHSTTTRMQLDTCYNCHKQGHWARECPEKAKIMTTEPCTAPESPTKHCPCGGGPCDVRISGTVKNPNRKFYSCPADPARRCNLFVWCDTVTDDDQRFCMPKSPYPVCSCGAGICSLFTVKNGVNVGRRFFVCRVKKGQGACNFFQWEDDVGKTIDKGNLDKENSVISHKPIVESHGDTRTEDCDTGKSSDRNEVERSSPPVSEERDTDTVLATENLVEEENAGLVSGANDTHLPPIQSLRLNEGGRFETSPKRGKSGHCMKGCSVL